jgi:hypothetical protein
MADTPVAPRWRVLFTPRWLSWHAFAVVAFVGMLWLGDWQFHRAIGGNALSWAYTFEWPIFAIFGAVFWVKTIKDELHPAKPAPAREVILPAGARSTDQPAGDRQQTVTDVGLDGELTVDGDQAEELADLEHAEYNAYLAMLSKEVKRHGKWHGLR